MQHSGKIAVDANAILSALIGGKAIKVFLLASGFEFLTTDSVVQEIHKYIPILSQKKGLDKNAMQAAFNLLNLKVVSGEVFSDKIPLAIELIAERDPDDVDLLALVLSMNCILWSNDNDLKEVEEIKIYTTAQILT